MEWFNDYIGIPFKTLGRDKDGCDCYGLVKLVLNSHYAIMLPELLEYADALDNQHIQEVVSDNVPLLSGEELDRPEEGAVVILSSGGLSAHIGLLVTDKLMLHTTSLTGAVIEPISSNRIKNRIRGIYSVNKSYSTK